MRPQYLKSILNLFLVLALFGACSESARPGAEDAKSVSVRFDVARSSVPLSDSLVLDLLGPDTVHAVLFGDSNVLSQKLSPGKWNFYAKFYANGILVEKGEADAQLSAGDEVSVPIAMHAVAGFLYVRIPLGLDNSTGVASGALSVRSENFSKDYPFEIRDAEASAATEILQLGKEYSVQVHLFSENGDTLFASSSTVLLDGENFALDMQLKSLHANVRLVISSDSARMLTAVGHLPSRLRAPSAGTIFVTEFMTEGKSEFVELYNASLDTLDLSDCELLATGSGNTLKIMTDSAFADSLPPNSFLVLGTDSCEGKDVRVPLSMPGTKGSIVFRCGGETLDSLFYVGPKVADSLGLAAFPIDSKLSAQLPIKNYRNRSLAASWCGGEVSKHAVARCEP